MAISCSSRCSGDLGGQQIAGDLFADELVVRLVAVEGVDDIVAIAPGVRIGQVARRAGRFAVAGHVEPVPAPAFAEARRGQQPIDDLLEGVGGVVLEERVDLLGRRRQAGQIEGHAADQRQPVRVADRRRASSPRAWPGRSDRCRRGPRPAFLTCGHLGLASTAARPSAPCAAFRTSRLGLPSEAGTVDLRPGGPVLDPVRQVGDLLRRRAASSGGIFDLVVRVPHRLDQQALLRIARERRPGRVLPPLSRPLRSSTRRPPLALVLAEWQL